MTTSNTPYAELVKRLDKRAGDQRERGWELMREGDPELLEKSARAIEALEAERDGLADDLDTILMHGVPNGGNVIVSRTEWVLVEDRFRKLASAIRSRSNATGEDKDGLTAQRTAPSPISIAPEALSEDGQPRVTLENLDQLSEIILDASVEGWEWTTFTRPDGSPIETVEHVAETTAHSARVSEGTELHGITFAGLGDEATGPNVVCYTGNGPHSAENARAIVSLWMAAPELIRLARSALSSSPTPPQAVTDVGGGEPSRAPDGYSTDDEGGLLEDLLDGHDHGAITELTPYWCGERQWAVVHYDEDGFADHRLFDSQDEARKFRDSTLLTNPNTAERGAVSGQDSGSSNCALEPTGAGASLSDDVHADGTSAATVEKVTQPD